MALVTWMTKRFLGQNPWARTNQSEDIQNICHLAIYKAASTFDESMGYKFAGWYTLVARTMLRNLFRTATIYRHANHFRDNPSLPNPEQPLELLGWAKTQKYIAPSKVTEDNDEIKKLMGCLTPEEQKLIHWRFYDGKSFDEIGKILGIKNGHPGQAAHYLIKKILAKMQTYAVKGWV